MRRPRITTWHLMALVAIASALLFVWVEIPRLRKRADLYRQRARTLAAWEARFRRRLVVELESRAYWSAMSVQWSRKARVATSDGREPSPRDADDSWADLADQATRLAGCRSSRIARLREGVGHYALLRRKYEEAAARPWVPLWPDPSPPPE